MCPFSSHTCVPYKHTNSKQTRIYLRITRTHIYALQTCTWGHSRSSYKRHGIIPSAITPNSCILELKCYFSLNYAWPQSRKLWFLFIALTVVLVVGSPATDLLESVDFLLRDCELYFPNSDRRMAEKLIVRLQVTIDSVRGFLDSLDRDEAGSECENSGSSVKAW